MLDFLRKKNNPQPAKQPAAARRTLTPQQAAQRPAANSSRTISNVVAMPTRSVAYGGTGTPPARAEVGTPTGSAVISTLAELPPNSNVISGRDKQSLIKLTDDQARLLCVIRIGQHEARVVLSPSFDELTKEQQRWLGNSVISEITNAKLTPGKPLRVTAEVMRGLLEGAQGRVNNDADTDEAKKTEAYRLFKVWGAYSVDADATDVHIEVRGTEVHQRFRIDTEIEPMANPQLVLPNDALNAIGVAYNKTAAAKTNSHSNFMPTAYQYAMFPFEHQGKQYKFRLQTLPTDDGFDIIMRRIPVGFQEDFLLYAPRGQRSQGFELSQAQMMLHAMESEMGGLIVVAGVTGSGKTTAVKAMLDQQPGGEGKKRIGVEDPKEYDIRNYTPLSIQRDVGDPDSSKRAYNQAYASLMRSDLDVGMVGEIRDNVSVNAAMVIAESGHLAIGSNHARSLDGIIPRMSSQQIGGDLHAMTEPDIWRLMVYQALVPVLCISCKVPIANATASAQQEMNWVAEQYHVDTSGVFVRNHDGCPKCRKGVKGMTVIAEMYEPSNDFLEHMRRRETDKARQLWLSIWDGKYDSDDMRGKTVFEHAFLKMLRGDIDPSVVRNRAKGQKFSKYLQFIQAIRAGGIK